MDNSRDIPYIFKQEKGKYNRAAITNVAEVPQEHLQHSLDKVEAMIDSFNTQKRIKCFAIFFGILVAVIATLGIVHAVGRHRHHGHDGHNGHHGHHGPPPPYDEHRQWQEQQGPPPPPQRKNGNSFDF
jgi:hypothetical protein